MERGLRNNDVVIHYGLIASGNRVIKDGAERDRVASELEGVLCFEMEAAGMMNTFPCLVIRGICDYADSHKNKEWQPYAAAMAAAYTKDLLSVIPPAAVAQTRTMIENLREKQGWLEAC
jgi:nucleoside phosphorylase